MSSKTMKRLHGSWSLRTFSVGKFCVCHIVSSLSVFVHLFLYMHLHMASPSNQLPSLYHSCLIFASFSSVSVLYVFPPDLASRPPRYERLTPFGPYPPCHCAFVSHVLVVRVIMDICILSALLRISPPVFQRPCQLLKHGLGRIILNKKRVTKGPGPQTGVATCTGRRMFQGV